MHFVTATVTPVWRRHSRELEAGIDQPSRGDLLTSTWMLDKYARALR
jgi:hypothetical protein